MFPNQRLVGRIWIYLGMQREMLTSREKAKKQKIIIDKRLMVFRGRKSPLKLKNKNKLIKNKKKEQE